MRIFFILSISIFSFSIARAQLKQLQRLEIEIKDHDFLLIPIAEKGIMLFQNDPSVHRKKNAWTFTRYDSAFQHKWQCTYPIDDHFYLATYYQTAGSFYVLYTKEKEIQTEFIILQFDIQTGKVNTIQDKFITAISLKKMDYLPNHFFFGGEADGNPIVIQYDLQQRKSSVLTGIFNPTNEWIDMQTDTLSGVCTILLRQRQPGMPRTFCIKSYTENGDLLNQITIRTHKKNLTYGKVLPRQDGIFIIGTYSNTANLTLSHGLFITKIENEQQMFIHYYPYAQMVNMFTYLSPKKIERIKRNIETRYKKGKESRIVFQAGMQDIIEYNNQFIYLSEFFYPKYIQSSNARGNMIGEIFEGWKYTHALICGFDRSGHLLWDNSLSINDVTKFTNEDFVRALTIHDTTCLVYNIDNDIKAKIVKQREVVKEKYVERIQPFSSYKIIPKETTMGEAAAWYQSYFLIWGNQEIIDYEVKDKPVRKTVFYANKLKLY